MGNFVISLDFELIWGIIDLPIVEKYKKNIIGVQKVIPKLLDLADKYDIKLTFGTVGFIYFQDKEQLTKNIPSLKPSYNKTYISPYYDYIEESCTNDEYHFAPHLIDLIRMKPQHEIASHTFCHYYCMEPGQNAREFREDLMAAIQVAEERGISLNSIIFPRNQSNEEYLDICRDLGFKCYRGNEQNLLHKKNNHLLPIFVKRALRLLDTYFPITGYNCYTEDEMRNDTIINIPASRFFRAFSKPNLFESLKIRRIKKEMKFAAKNNKTYHLWWHPHNIGINQEENFTQIENIFKYYYYLHVKYGFNSTTMNNLANHLING